METDGANHCWKDRLALFTGSEVRSLVNRGHDMPASWHWHPLAGHSA